MAQSVRPCRGRYPDLSARRGRYNIARRNRLQFARRYRPVCAHLPRHRQRVYLVTQDVWRKVKAALNPFDDIAKRAPPIIRTARVPYSGNVAIHYGSSTHLLGHVFLGGSLDRARNSPSRRCAKRRVPIPALPDIRGYVRYAMPRERDRASADQGQASVDQRLGRAHEPHDQGSDRPTLPLRSTRSARSSPRRLHHRLQLRSAAEDPSRASHPTNTSANAGLPSQNDSNLTRSSKCRD